MTTPISKKSTKTAGILFVDDTNLWAGLDSEKDLETAVWEAQEGVNSWGGLLMALAACPVLSLRATCVG